MYNFKIKLGHQFEPRHPWTPSTVVEQHDQFAVKTFDPDNNETFRKHEQQLEVLFLLWNNSVHIWLVFGYSMQLDDLFHREFKIKLSQLHHLMHQYPQQRVWKNQNTLKTVQMLKNFLNTKMRLYIHRSIQIGWRTFW